MVLQEIKHLLKYYTIFVQSFSLSQLFKPCIKEDMIFVQIS